MYTSVTDKFDVAYLSVNPENHMLHKYDGPEEKIQLREVVGVWFECAFLHASSNDSGTIDFLTKKRVCSVALKEYLAFSWNPLLEKHI